MRQTNDEREKDTRVMIETVPELSQILLSHLNTHSHTMAVELVCRVKGGCVFGELMLQMKRYLLGRTFN